jgi:hypothetical protein
VIRRDPPISRRWAFQISPVSGHGSRRSKSGEPHHTELSLPEALAILIEQHWAAKGETKSKFCLLPQRLQPCSRSARHQGAMMACTSENLAKSVAATDAMQDSPGKRAMMKELSSANTAMSKGDMRAACTS